MSTGSRLVSSLGLALVLAAAALAIVAAFSLRRGLPALARLDAADDSGTVAYGRFTSAALGWSMPYLVYTPPGYEAEAGVRYPVLYMLHGLGGSYEQWQGFGLLQRADAMMRAGEIPPFMIVLAQGDRAYWVNHADGGPSWATYVSRDLVAEIDGRYRTLAGRESRAIGGVSMGGHGALQLAINNPDVFGVVGAHSFALRRHEAAPAYFGDKASFDQRDPVFLYNAKADAARTLTIWLDIGSEDVWHPAATGFHEQLSASGVPHVWHVWPGGHEGSYWIAHVEDYLRFYGEALRVASPSDEDPRLLTP